MTSRTDASPSSLKSRLIFVAEQMLNPEANSLRMKALRDTVGYTSADLCTVLTYDRGPCV